MNIHIFKDDLGDVDIVFYESGKYKTPIMILGSYELDRIIEKYKDQKKKWEKLNGKKKK